MDALQECIELTRSYVREPDRAKADDIRKRLQGVLPAAETLCREVGDPAAVSGAFRRLQVALSQPSATDARSTVERVQEPLDQIAGWSALRDGLGRLRSLQSAIGDPADLFVRFATRVLRLATDVMARFPNAPATRARRDPKRARSDPSDGWMCPKERGMLADAIRPRAEADVGATLFSRAVAVAQGRPDAAVVLPKLERVQKALGGIATAVVRDATGPLLAWPAGRELADAIRDALPFAAEPSLPRSLGDTHVQYTVESGHTAAVAPFDPAQWRELLHELRSDFNALKRTEHPVHIRLIHRATNAEAEGVAGDPPRGGRSPVAGGSAGFREGVVRHTASGAPSPVDPPILNVMGMPILDNAGHAIDVIMPATRSVELTGDRRAVARLQSLAARAGQLLANPPIQMQAEFAGWRFATPEERWWALVFEYAWSGRHPLLTALRRIWLADGQGEAVLLPYDLAQLREMKRSPLLGIDKRLPEAWLKRLPDAYVSELDDAATASADALRMLAEELALSVTDELAASPPPSQAHGAKTARDPGHAPTTGIPAPFAAADLPEAANSVVARALEEVIDLSRALAVSYPESAARLCSERRWLDDVRNSLVAKRRKEGLDPHDPMGWVYSEKEFRSALSSVNSFEIPCATAWEKVCRLRELAATCLPSVFLDLRFLPVCILRPAWHDQPKLDWCAVVRELRLIETAARREFLALSAAELSRNAIAPGDAKVRVECADSLTAPETEPDERGFVQHPPDSSAYVPASQLLVRHTPDDLSITPKQLAAILTDFTANRVRWTRPPGRDGRPRPNRLNVHLSDWLGYIERRRAESIRIGEGGWPVVPQAEVERRKQVIRRHEASGK